MKQTPYARGAYMYAGPVSRRSATTSTTINKLLLTYIVGAVVISVALYKAGLISLY